MTGNGVDPGPVPRLPAGGGGAILANLIAFAGVLRASGLAVTTERIGEVAEALGELGVDDRERTFRTCRSLLVHRREDLALFERLFRWFWRDLADPTGAGPRRLPAPPRRRPRLPGQFTVATYMAFKAGHAAEEVDVSDRSGTFSAEELLWSRRFADMTEEELTSVQRIVRDMEWSVSLRRTRRYRPDRRGSSIDLRRVLRDAGRLGSVPARLRRRRRLLKRRPLVLLADISGSMERYSRLVLHFFHAVVSSVSDVETFAFGTRLSRITPELRVKNIDRAIEDAARVVLDWSGGTRIGGCLATFNREWGRRLLRRGAVVVLISDGCEREGEEPLAREMRRLQMRCHRLIWLNPFLGHEAYAPRVAGMAAALPFIDDFLPVHDLQSLDELSRTLARVTATGRTARRYGAPDPPGRPLLYGGAGRRRGEAGRDRETSWGAARAGETS